MVCLSDIFNGYLLQPLVLQEAGDALYHGAAYLEVYRQGGILMSNIDACAYNKIYLVALHNQPDYLVSRSLAQLDAARVSLQQLIDLL